MVTFDGANKLMICDAGVTTLDVRALYSDWKRWSTESNNLMFLNAFDVVGGEPTVGTSSITPYFFLTNGWKIRPQEANHTLKVDGILITDDDSDPFVDTIDTYRIGIQAIVPLYAETTEVNNESIVYSSFQGAVWVDVENGRDTIGTPTFPNGNTERPVNSIQLATSIAKERGFRRIEIIGNITLDTGDDVRGFLLTGTSHVNSTIEVLDGCLCKKTKFASFRVSGKLDGDSEIDDCVIGDLTYFDGYIHDCMLDGVITLGGTSNAVVDNCAVLNVVQPVTINCNNSNQNLIMTNWSGSLNIGNSGIGNNIGIGCDAADIHLLPSCTGGIIAISGMGAVEDNSGAACYVVNKLVDGSEVQNLKVLVEQLRPHHTGGGKMIFWDPYTGSDTHHGDSPDRAFKTFAMCHAVAGNAEHDTIVIVPGDPSGVTVITEQVTITKDYLFLRGPGRDVIFQVESDDYAIKVDARGAELSGFRVQHTTTTGYGVHSVGAFTLLANLWFEGCVNGAYFTASHPIIRQVKFYKPTGFGIRFQGDVFAGEITNCSIGGSGTNGIEVDTTSGLGGIKMEDTVVIGSAEYGITLSDSTTSFIVGASNTIGKNASGNILDQGTGNILNTTGTSSGMDEDGLHAALDSYNNKSDYQADVSNLSADVNVVAVAGTAVTSIDDFKATTTTVDISAIVEAVWAAGVRTLTDQMGLTQDEHTQLMALELDVNNTIVSQGNKTRNTILTN